MIRIDLPTSEKEIRSLKVGDRVSLYGTIVTARDAAHKFMAENWPDFVAPLLKDGAIYHCGPVMRRVKDGWRAVAAGPTTSIREEIYEADVIERYGVRIVIGKGGMGSRTLEALKKFGAVYLHAPGGAASLLADSIIKTKEVHMLGEFGAPEAFWVFEVAGMGGVVTMDSNGKSLHDELWRESKKVRDRLLKLV